MLSERDDLILCCDYLDALRAGEIDNEDMHIIGKVSKALRAHIIERAAAITAARAVCVENDLDNTWPDSLHLADVIEKRIGNLVRGRHLPADEPPTNDECRDHGVANVDDL